MILIFIPRIFFALYFVSQYQCFFSLCYLFSSWKLKTIVFRVTIPQGQHHVSSAQQSWVLFRGIRTWMGDQTPNIPCGSNFFFFHSLSKAILKTAELPSLVWCRSFYFSAICASFCHVPMSAFACIFTISYNRPNKQPDPSFEFFSILLTFGRLKQ